MRLLGTRTDTTEVSYEYLFDRAPLAIALMRGPDHRYVLVNEAFIELFGDRGYVGRTFRECFPELPPSVTGPVDRAYESGAPLRNHQQLRFDLPSGRRETYLSYVLEPTRDARGSVDGLAFYAWDVTDRTDLRQDLERLSAEQRKLDR
jgi:PAS domain-containing protein